MSPIRRLFVSAFFICSAATPSFSQPGDAHGGFADLVEKLSPAVVNISTAQKIKSTRQAIPFGMPFDQFPDTPEFEPFREFFDRFGQMQQPQEREVFSLGSGFIIDASGYVITNNHVIDDAEEITVTLPDNTKYTATVVGRDPKTDLALLKVEPKKPLPFVPMGDSDAMRVGDWVIAIGNPYGLGGTVTQGIISARQRSINAGPFDDFLQTDAPINRGNSGGPLFNVKGEVIGINSAIFSPSGGSVGIGFAIPTALAKPIIEQLKAGGHVKRGWLGVKIQEVSDEVADSVGLAKPMGALVIDVSKDSPAAKAGIESGDVITAFNGKDISEMRFLPRMVAETPIGRSAPVTIWRKGASKTVSVTLGELEDEEDANSNPPAKGKAEKGSREGERTVLGMGISALTPALRNELRLDKSVGGVVVVDVKSGSEAARRGIRPGDVIIDINGEKTSTSADVVKQIEAARTLGRKFVLARILRGKEEALITLPAEDKK